MSPTPAELLTVVARSPDCVAAHDRSGWLGLFADEALVEDPVGAPPAPKADGRLGRFWDTFIAPHEIRFEIRRDHVLGRDVFRDAIIHTRIGRALAIDVPAYLLYQLDERGGRLVLERMAAHWQLGRLSLAALRLGPRAWIAMTRLFARMLRRMGPGWVAGYLASLWNGVGRRGLEAVGVLQRAIDDSDAVALCAACSEGATLELGARAAAPSQLLTLFPRGSRLRVEAPVAAGWTASFRFALDGPTPRAGLALIEFAPGTRAIRRARFFADAV